MNIFFDVDYTILGMDDTLRPQTREVFQRLVADGHRIYIWSGHGIRWGDIRRHGLADLVVECYEKPLRDYEKALPELGVPLVPDFAVDDYPEVPSAFGGVWVPPYYFARYSDQEMERVYRIVQEYTATGTSSDKQFRPRGYKIPLF